MPENKIKVCHLTSVHKANDIRIFHKECLSLYNAGFNVHIIASNTKNETINNIEIHTYNRKSNNRFFRIFESTRKIYKLSKQIDADIYHFHDPELIFLGYLLKKRKKKVIYDVHEDLPEQLYQKHWVNPILRKILGKSVKLVEKYFSSKFDAVITTTPHINNRFLTYNKNTFQVCNFPKFEEFSTIEHDWKKKDNTVCYVGAIFKERGIIEVIESLFKTKVTLLLAGAFSPIILEDEVKRVDGWENVKYNGVVDRDGIVKILNSSIAGIVTLHPLKSYQLSYPIKMFEYMLAGIPVIASKFPLWQEIIEVNNCGVCVDPQNPNEIKSAIEYVASNPSIAKQMGENGRRIVIEKFNWSNEEEKLVNIYKSILIRNE